jgi:hypothetical protein
MKTVNITLSITAKFNIDELPSAYLNEEYVTEIIKEHITYSFDRLDAEDVVFNHFDVEGLR